MPEIALFSLLGFGVGIFSGLLGIGGAILMIPAALFLPGFMGFPAIGLKQATGLAATQGLASSISGFWVHHRNKNLSLTLIQQIGLLVMPSSFLGAWASAYCPDWLLKTVYIVTLLWVMRQYIRKTSDISEESDARAINTGADAIFKEPGLLITIVGIGVLSGMLGLGGAILLIPILQKHLKLPLKFAIGTTSGIVALSCLTAFIGKYQTGLIALPLAAAITLGALLGAAIGAKLTKHAPEALLRWLLFGFASLALLRILLT
ncbi:MAG: sulfite exporter TauE/SafE family protein [Cyanobacteria bacterium]|nr:sulfite exporter TauE/SafE family protein [Cyanobacteriota bacterium]